MKKLILTFYLKKSPCIYYIDISEDRKKFRFNPSSGNKECPSFTIYLINQELWTSDDIEEELLEQAKTEVKFLVKSGLLFKIDELIRNSFLQEVR